MTQARQSDFAAKARRLVAQAGALRGWRRALAAFLAGVCAALAMAPFYLLPLLAVAFTTLIILLDGVAGHERQRLRAFWTGWAFGFGYFLAGLYWMAFSFFVQADQFAWMAPFAVTLMPAGLALFTGAAAATAIAYWRKGWGRIVIFTAVFALFEYARGHLLTGLPWNLTGQAFAATAMTGQIAAWLGAYGLSLIAILLACLPALGLAQGQTWRQTLSGSALALSGFALLLGFGALRLIDSEPAPQTPEIWVRIVQPNIGQRDKINPDKWGENFYRQLALSTEPAPPGAMLYIIWPENGAPLVNEAETALDILATELPEEALLLAGAVRRIRQPDAPDRYYNSLAVISPTPEGRAASVFYDKHHLVPFGEYLPFYSALNAIGLAQLTPYGDAGFAGGEGPRVLDVGPAPFAPLICYEAIFPRAIYPADDRPRWLVTVTNDAWFGDTSGPRQHLDQARLRSIESGLPMARSANTGISALIDAKGRMISRLGLYQEGKIDAPLPRALPPTLYDFWGDWPFVALAAGLFLCGWRQPK